MNKKLRVNYQSYIGKKFGKWTILSFQYLKNRIHFNCQCECGATSFIQGQKVKTGFPKSCLSCAFMKHGCSSRAGKRPPTPTYRVWNGLRNRCNNKNNKDYPSYGGRGIKVCDRWNDFTNFVADMGEKPLKLSLDRINNDGDYEPSNCRWATYSQQNINQRKRTAKQELKS